MSQLCDSVINRQKHLLNFGAATSVERMTAIQSPELLLPAGSPKRMRYAFAYGADAVYAGHPRYSLRMRNNEFSDTVALVAGMREARALHRKFYITCNIVPHNNKLRTFLRDLEPILAERPDGLIVADPGFILLLREHAPEVPLHLSVQANAINHSSVRFWQNAGIRRVILSRELELSEIAEIRRECPDMEIETFVHGALCIAHSGRCLLSGYINNRDSNQGNCTNACRWDYTVHPAHETAEGIYLLEQSQHPGRLMPMFEDEHGTYIMNSRDLRAIRHVAELTALGVHSLKIEGRTKSHYYAARTARAYRRAIDDAVSGCAFDERLIDELDGLANRGYTDGFFERRPVADQQSYDSGLSNLGQVRFVGEVAGRASNGLLRIEVKNRFVRGDLLELITPRALRRFTLDRMEDELGRSIDTAPGNGYRVAIALPDDVAEDELQFALLSRVDVDENREERASFAVRTNAGFTDLRR